MEVLSHGVSAVKARHARNARGVRYRNRACPAHGDNGDCRVRWETKATPLDLSIEAVQVQVHYHARLRARIQQTLSVHLCGLETTLASANNATVLDCFLMATF